MLENALSSGTFAVCSLGIPNGLYDCPCDWYRFIGLKLLFAWACDWSIFGFGCWPCDSVLIADVVPLDVNDMPFTTPVFWALDGKEGNG